ncbi:MAG: hypothetical protein JAZ20_05160 [Candidatus Thiodiazotropha weberae]|nr:hypothetical protein [Candidatus Thiodiazotropha lotti]MCG8012428.1 hypothetical protein [Candidatus Thiodiazotropha lotti]MCG8019787.1 hypothetical protein [Candidatus Thiodiazotropha lotti]MCW4206949.1 hypothetical protein [Candidatus Thiodiazotropha lotti]MCW4211898.1 hypothetical protein [Candidatus Thiodiazotropha lotti]
MSESDKLPEDSGLNRLYHAGRHEAPSEALDQAVLNQARKATAKHRNRWIVPLSSAALLLLGIGLSLPLIDLRNDIYDQPPRLPAPAPQADSRFESDQTLQIPAQAPASSAIELQKRSEPVPQAELTSPPLMEQRARAKAREGAAERKQLQEAPETILQSIDSEKAHRTPELWLTEIEALIEAGQDQAARRSLDAFMVTYPDYPLPKSLQSWQSAQ